LTVRYVATIYSNIYAGSIGQIIVIETGTADRVGTCRTTCRTFRTITTETYRNLVSWLAP